MVRRAERPADFESYVTVLCVPHLRRTAFLLTGDGDRAEDVVQDTLTRLFVHWRRAQRADDLDAYVRRMLVNAFLSEKRRPWRRERSTDELPETAYADPTDGVLMIATSCAEHWPTSDPASARSSSCATGTTSPSSRPPMHWAARPAT